MIVPVQAVGQLGLITDLPFAQIPLNAWTSGRNVRFRDGAVEKFQGHNEIYATPSWAPYWLLPAATATAYFWLYANATKAGATDGATHADVTRVAGDYTADLNDGWTGTILEGVPIVNNGTDDPQMWNTPALATPLEDLSNWPADTSCKALRGLKRYLIAMDVTKSGTRYPYMVKWSHQAPVGGLPTSWDETDETIDAAEFSLPTDGGFVIDGAPLRDSMIVYKEYQTWLMELVGGIDIFTFRKKFDSFGALTRRSAAEFFSGKQAVFTGDDIVVHDSQQAKSVLDTRGKALIAGQIDSDQYRKSFIAVNYQAKEIWVCFPESGSALPNKAIIWNWMYDTLGVRDLPLAAFIAPGIVDPIDATELWSGTVGTWDTDGTAWGERSYSPSERKMLMAVPGQTKLFLPDSSGQFDGTNMTAYVQRDSLGFPLKQNGPPDFTTMKRFTGIWPEISGTTGGIVNVYVGVQERIGGTISWSDALPFTIGTTKFIDYIAPDAPLHALKFESTADLAWKLHAYSVEIVAVGKH